MHLTPGVVHNFPKAVGVWNFCPLCTKISEIPILKEKGATPQILVSRLNNRWQYTTPGLCGRTAMLNTKLLVKHTIKEEKSLLKVSAGCLDTRCEPCFTSPATVLAATRAFTW